jgi:hypothetical protein
MVRYPPCTQNQKEDPCVVTIITITQSSPSRNHHHHAIITIITTITTITTTQLPVQLKSKAKVLQPWAGASDASFRHILPPFRCGVALHLSP